MMLVFGLCVGVVVCLTIVCVCGRCCSLFDCEFCCGYLCAVGFFSLVVGLWSWLSCGCFAIVGLVGCVAVGVLIWS